MRIEINSMDDVVNFFLIFLRGVNKLCAGTWNTILDNRASILLRVSMFVLQLVLLQIIVFL